jgi:hypothetical protein
MIGNPRHHLPIRLCNRCLVGEYVPAYRNSIGGWAIGEVITFHENEASNQFLLNFAFEGNETEIVHVESDPFATFAAEYRRKFQVGKMSDYSCAKPVHHLTKSPYRNNNVRDIELSPLSYDESNIATFISQTSSDSFSVRESLECPTLSTNNRHAFVNEEFLLQGTLENVYSEDISETFSEASTAKRRRLGTEKVSKIV